MGQASSPPFRASLFAAPGLPFSRCRREAPRPIIALLRLVPLAEVERSWIFHSLWISVKLLKKKTEMVKKKTRTIVISPETAHPGKKK